MTRVVKARLDSLLVKRGLAADQRSAQSLIMAGEVLVDDIPLDKAGAMVADDSLIRLRERAQFVSRGGEKLAAALDNFAIKAPAYMEGKVIL